MRSTSTKPMPYGRAGLSALEFLGCMLALIGGAWLGAIYLGIDLRHVAYLALSESELMDKVPENWRPPDTEGANSKPTSDELAQAVRSELQSLRGEITALRSAQDSTVENTTGTTPHSKNGSAKKQTIDYWSRVRDVVTEHAEMQQTAESAATENNAIKLAALKARIYRFAASGLRAIPTQGVDMAAVRLSNELAAWYEQSGALYDRAVTLWESAVRGQGTALTKDWDSAQLQLQNEAKLLGDKIAAVRDSLSRRFGEDFAEIPHP